MNFRAGGPVFVSEFLPRRVTGAGGPAFERFLNFRVADPSAFFEGSQAVVQIRVEGNTGTGPSVGHASITSERDETQLALSVVNEFVCHGRKVQPKPRPFKRERVGHPEKLNQFLSIDVLEWYAELHRSIDFSVRQTKTGCRIR